jgi:hypothetical protein
MLLRTIRCRAVAMHGGSSSLSLPAIAWNTASTSMHLSSLPCSSFARDTSLESFRFDLRSFFLRCSPPPRSDTSVGTSVASPRQVALGSRPFSHQRVGSGRNADEIECKLNIVPHRVRTGYSAIRIRRMKEALR